MNESNLICQAHWSSKIWFVEHLFWNRKWLILSQWLAVTSNGNPACDESKTHSPQCVTLQHRFSTPCQSVSKCKVLTWTNFNWVDWLSLLSNLGIDNGQSWKLIHYSHWVPDNVTLSAMPLKRTSQPNKGAMCIAGEPLNHVTHNRTIITDNAALLRRWVSESCHTIGQSSQTMTTMHCCVNISFQQSATNNPNK